MSRDDALGFVCSSLCLEIQTVDLDILRAPKFIPVPAIDPETDLVTWLVEGGRFLILVQSINGTRVYDTEDDYLYYAMPHTQLSSSCPVGHAFLCQTVQDKQPDGTHTLRLLVTDLVSPRIDCPVRRGEALRGMGPFLPQVCHVQWAGNRKALEQFVASGVVPHRVAGLVALRAPLELARESSTGIAALDALDLAAR